MSIADVKRAFQETIGTKGSVIEARMGYVKGEKRAQSFVFTVVLPTGKTVHVEAELPHEVEPNERARQIGRTYADSLTAPNVPDVTKIEKNEAGGLRVRLPATKVAKP